MEKTDVFLFKFNVKSNDFYINCNTNRTEEKENINLNTMNWGEMSWFIIKTLKDKKSENVKKF